MSTEGKNGRAVRQARLISVAWVVLSIVWASVMIFSGDFLWPMVGWFATTFAPLTFLASRSHG